MSLKAEVRAFLAAREVGANDFDGPVYAPTLEQVLQFADGTAAGQADILFADERSIAASANDDLDLAGALASAFGATIAAAELVALLVINRPKDPAAAANVSNITLGLGSNPFLGFLGGTNPTLGPIRPGGMLLLACGDAAGLGTVTGGAADVLRIANGSGGTAKVQVGILARSA